MKKPVTRGEMKKLIAALRDVIEFLPAKTVDQLRAMEADYIQKYGDDLPKPKTTLADLIGAALSESRPEKPHFVDIMPNVA